MPSMLFNITSLEFQRKKMKNQWHLHHSTILEKDSGKLAGELSWELPLIFFLPSTSYRYRTNTIYFNFFLALLDSMNVSYELSEYRELWNSCLGSDPVLADIQTFGVLPSWKVSCKSLRSEMTQLWVFWKIYWGKNPSSTWHRSEP